MDLSRLDSDAGSALGDILRRCVHATFILFPGTQHDGSVVPRPGLEAALQAARDLDTPRALLCEGKHELPEELVPPTMIRFNDRAPEPAIIELLRAWHDAGILG